MSGHADTIRRALGLGDTMGEAEFAALAALAALEADLAEARREHDLERSIRGDYLAALKEIAADSTSPSVLRIVKRALVDGDKRRQRAIDTKATLASDSERDTG